MADPYLQADGRTLRNRLGIVGDPARLQDEETVRVQLRRAELRTNGLPDARGFDLVRAMHRHLFQDVYEWAGQLRATSLTKLHHEGASARTTFTPPGEIERVGQAVFAAVDRARGLRDLAPPAFAAALAPHVSALNVVHPFREGNGRTQRLVWEHVARQAGHDLGFEGISKERMVAASIAGERGDLGPFRRMLEELLDPDRRRALLTATRFLEQARAGGSPMDWNERYVSTTTPGQRYEGVFAGAAGRDFMLGSGVSILIGQVADLPGGGAGLKNGDPVSFKAGRGPGARQERGGLSPLDRALAAATARLGPPADERPPTPIAGREARVGTPSAQAPTEPQPEAAPRRDRRPRGPDRDPSP